MWTVALRENHDFVFVDIVKNVSCKVTLKLIPHLLSLQRFIRVEKVNSRCKDLFVHNVILNSVYFIVPYTKKFSLRMNFVKYFISQEIVANVNT